jgi:hypothetical protein
VVVVAASQPVKLKKKHEKKSNKNGKPKAAPVDANMYTPTNGTAAFWDNLRHVRAIKGWVWCLRCKSWLSHPDARSTSNLKRHHEHHAAAPPAASDSKEEVPVSSFSSPFSVFSSSSSRGLSALSAGSAVTVVPIHEQLSQQRWSGGLRKQINELIVLAFSHNFWSFRSVENKSHINNTKAQQSIVFIGSLH